MLLSPGPLWPEAAGDLRFLCGGLAGLRPSGAGLWAGPGSWARRRCSCSPVACIHASRPRHLVGRCWRVLQSRLLGGACIYGRTCLVCPSLLDVRRKLSWQEPGPWIKTGRLIATSNVAEGEGAASSHPRGCQALERVIARTRLTDTCRKVTYWVPETGNDGVVHEQKEGRSKFGARGGLRRS